MKEPNPKVINYLENLYKNTNHWKFNPASLYKGAHSVISTEDDNPDWMAQSANSLREITYLLRQGPEDPDKKILVKQAFEVFIENLVDEDLAKDILLLENVFSKIAHHGSLKDVKTKIRAKGIELYSAGKIDKEQYLKILQFADEVFLKVLPMQVGTHEEIDKVVKNYPDDKNLEKVKYLVSLNEDAKDYFYSSVTGVWVEWLHENGFFTILNKAAENPNQYSFRMPELGYLERIVSEKPNEVTRIMLEVDPVVNHNPEVVDRFTRITESLRRENLTQMVQKIHDENWVRLMSRFNTWSYAYADIVKNLVEEGNVDSLILLADVLLSVKKDRDEVRSNPFELTHMRDISLFEAFVALEGDNLEKAYRFLVKKLAEVIGDGLKDDAENRVFKIEEPYYFFDVDLFTHDFGEKYSHSYRDDIENFIAAIVLITRKIFAGGCGQERRLRGVYSYLNKTLPDSWSGWRLRLFTASFCGELFRTELESMFNRLFEVMKEKKSYYEIESGTEYKKALKQSWPELSYDFKQLYIKNIFEYFNPAKAEDKESAGYFSRDAISILKMIKVDVNDSEVLRVFGYSLNDERIPDPRPIIGRSEFSEVVDRSPIKIADRSVVEIISLLKGDLKPETIETKYKDDPFHNPRSVEGVGSEIRSDVEKRLDEYLDHIAEFFEPSEVDAHYTYSVLNGVENALRNKQAFSEERWQRLFVVIEAIQKDDLPTEDEGRRSFLGSWRAVRRICADILKYTINKEFLTDEVFVDHRERILAVLESLLYSGDPKPEYEEGKYGDLITVAINHTMGVAYQAFIQFLYRDGETLKDDAKKIFKDLLEKNQSLSTWSMIGQYLPSVYYRDSEWVKYQLPKIFRVANQDQFFSAWEGYVITSVYKEVFEVMDKYYEHALLMDDTDYPKRVERKRDFDQSIGVHLALAYTHFVEVTLDHKLIKLLWEKADVRKQCEFISHIGRGFISSNLIKPDEAQINKVLKLWDWLLDKKKGEVSPQVYGEFGLWVRDKGIEDITSSLDLARRFAKTMELSGGRLDYEYHLKDKLILLAEADAGSVLSIMRNLLLGEESENSRNIWIRSDAASTELFSVLYRTYPREVTQLVNDLIEKKGRVFWGLKSVLK